MKARTLLVTGALCCCSGRSLLCQETNNLAPVEATPTTTPPKSIVWRPMSTDERMDWYLGRTIGRSALIRGAAVAGWATLRDHPMEWNQDADGFAARMASRFARVAISNSVQMGLGFALKDDPRYYRAPEKGTGGRVKNAIVLTVAVRNSSGGLMPAYSRFAGIGVSNIVTKAWLPPSQNSWSDVGIRSAGQLGTQVGFNLLREFWPDIKRKIKK